MLDVESQEQWLERLGAERVAALRAKADPDSWRADAAAYPPDLDAPVERVGARRGVGRAPPRRRASSRPAPTRCSRARASRTSRRGSACSSRATRARDVKLTAEIGLWGYDATLGDPFVLNHRNFPTATMLADAQMVLGALVGGAGTTTIGCLGGAQVDRFGNINSTRIPPRPFLVGSGGGNDVASTAAENVDRRDADAAAHRRRLRATSRRPARTCRRSSPTSRTFEKRDGVLQVSALAPGVAFDEVRALCGWELESPAGDAAGARRARPPTRSRRCAAGIRAAGSSAARSRARHGLSVSG